MEASFTALTTYDEVRAQLGASESEFPDVDMDSAGLDKELELDLLDWFPEYAALAVDADTSVASQLLALKVYSAAFCALSALTGSTLLFLQKKVDGDNQWVRFSHKDSLNEFRDALLQKVAKYRARVLSVTTAHSPAADTTETAILGFGISTPATDVIVG